MSIISTPFKEALVALILCLIIGCDRHSTVTPLKRIDIKADCTGLTFNEGGDAVVINFGKHYYKDSCFKPQIVVMDHEFKTVKRTIDLWRIYPEMKDVQGIAYVPSDTTYWICCYGENLVRHIDTDGNLLEQIYLKKPSGITYDTNRQTLWILANDNLFTLRHKILERKFKVSSAGNDHLFLDTHQRK